MQKPSKKVLSAIVTTMFVVACSNQNQVQNLPTKNDNKFEIKALPSGDPSVAKLTSLPTPPLMNPINDLNEVRKEEKLDFDTPPVIDNANAIDGAITVIYKNNHKVRLDKKLKKVNSISSDLTEVSNILDKYKLMDSNDLGDEKQSDAEMDKMQNDFQKKHNVDIPHLKSIHYYQFPKGTDTVALCKELMNLPMVRMAYPTKKPTSSSVITKIGTTDVNETNPQKPSDPAFGYSENYNWYWFNRHRIFKAWDYYNSFNLPATDIAIIDSGFNPNSTEINFDPSYSYYFSGGNLVKASFLANCPNNSCVLETLADDPSRRSSHGSLVAGVAGGKKNNGTGLCGVAPGARITPMKASDSYASVAKAIQYAADNNFVDVINISQGYQVPNKTAPLDTSKYIDVPISESTDVNVQISYAVSTKNKPVVITAGNNATDPTLYPYNAVLPTTLAVVVGGSMYSTNTGKSKAWIDPNNSSFGSNYTSANKNIISLAASAYNISSIGYDKIANQDSFFTESGTSLSAPMVAATIGMMRRINPNLTATQLKDIVTYSSNLYKYDDGYNGSASTKFIGSDLMNNSVNNGLMAGIRDLNSYNALVIAKNINNYNAIMRSYNVDDFVVMANSTTSNAFLPSNTVDNYGIDSIYGINSISSGSYINFAEFNISSGCTYGYQVYRNSSPINSFNKSGGVAGIAGVPTGCNPINNNYNYPMAYQYY